MLTCNYSNKTKNGKDNVEQQVDDYSNTPQRNYYINKYPDVIFQNEILRLNEVLRDLIQQIIQMQRQLDRAQRRISNQQSSYRQLANECASQQKLIRYLNNELEQKKQIENQLYCGLQDLKQQKKGIEDHYRDLSKVNEEYRKRQKFTLHANQISINQLMIMNESLKEQLRIKSSPKSVRNNNSMIKIRLEKEELLKQNSNVLSNCANVNAASLINGGPSSIELIEHQIFRIDEKLRQKIQHEIKTSKQEQRQCQNKFQVEKTKNQNQQIIERSKIVYKSDHFASSSKLKSLLKGKILPKTVHSAVEKKQNHQLNQFKQKCIAYEIQLNNLQREFERMKYLLLDYQAQNIQLREKCNKNNR